MGRTQVDLSIAARVCTCVHPLTPMVAVCSHVQACAHTHTESLFHKAETQSGAVAGGKSGGRTVWEFAEDVYTLLHLTWARPTVRSGSPAQGHVAARMGVESGGEGCVGVHG